MTVGNRLKIGLALAIVAAGAFVEVAVPPIQERALIASLPECGAAPKCSIEAGGWVSVYRWITVCDGGRNHGWIIDRGLPAGQNTYARERCDPGTVRRTLYSDESVRPVSQNVAIQQCGVSGTPVVCRL